MIKTDVSVGINYSTADIKSAVCSHIPVLESEIKNLEIVKKTLKIEEGKPSYRLTVAIEVGTERECGLLKMKKKCSPYERPSLAVPRASFDSRPIVVGAGPAGLFCALVLAEAGARPIIIERGEQVEHRSLTVASFFSGGPLSEESNVQYGEGGAGAFSDGKLKVGSVDAYKMKVLESFVSAGAPEDIIYTVGSHLGTDKLPKIVGALREKIIALGGEALFNTRVVDLLLEGGRARGVVCERAAERFELMSDRIVFATGHSAEDTLEMLLSKGIPMEQRGFGIGLRIEHERERIDRLVLGDGALAASVGTASYHLVTHLPSGRSVYSFCMCPGGTVVAAASKRGGIVTNGMSEQARMADNSNAAHLVSLTPKDFGSEHPLAGIKLQRRIEKAAFALSDSYKAPSISMGEFLGLSASGGIAPSYPVGTVKAAPGEYLPDYVSDSLKAGLYDFDAWMPGFITEGAVLTGPETRSTSPVRVMRGESFEAAGFAGVYPIGEGAGYAGGIVSSAVDGVRCAMAMLLSGK